MDTYDVMVFVKSAGDGKIKMTLTHTMAGVTVDGIGIDKVELKKALLIKLEKKVEERNAKVEILAGV